jgi:hypothetical protein
MMHGRALVAVVVVLVGLGAAGAFAALVATGTILKPNAVTVTTTVASPPVTTTVVKVVSIVVTPPTANLIAAPAANICVGLEGHPKLCQQMKRLDLQFKIQAATRRLTGAEGKILAAYKALKRLALQGK